MGAFLLSLWPVAGYHCDLPRLQSREEKPARRAPLSLGPAVPTRHEPQTTASRAQMDVKCSKIIRKGCHENLLSVL